MFGLFRRSQRSGPGFMDVGSTAESIRYFDAQARGHRAEAGNRRPGFPAVFGTGETWDQLHTRLADYNQGQADRLRLNQLEPQFERRSRGRRRRGAR